MSESAAAWFETGRPGGEGGDRCSFEHKIFQTFNDASFRRSDTDGAPVLVIWLGEREALIPLPSLAREFGIAVDSPDGRMLAMVAEALDFVPMLRLGDPLPPEVRTGEASWTPAPIHGRLAAARMRLQLLAWLSPQTGRGVPSSAGDLLRLNDDPSLREQVQVAFAKAAVELGLPGPDSVIQLIEGVATELAFIEALRDRLLTRVERVVSRLTHLTRGQRRDTARLETLSQVQRLSAIGLKQLRARFDALEAQTGDVLATLRLADKQRGMIRSTRDWLYRSQRGWEPILQAWEAAPDTLDEAMTGLLNKTYKFLAPRFMPVTEWRSASSAAPTPEPTEARMVW